MADVLVTGIKIGDMPLKGTVSGNEKLPTGDVGDLAVTPNQIKDFTIQEGNLINQEQLDDAIESVEQTSSGLAGRVQTLEDRTSYVDNTSDLDKPISNATQTALNAKADKVDVDAKLDLKADKDKVVSSLNGQVGEVILNQSDLVELGEDFSTTPIFQDVPKLTNPDGSSIPEFDSQIQPLVNSLAVHRQGLTPTFDQVYAASIGGYPLNARIMLDNGDIVRSTVANNTVNPNSDMTGWVYEFNPLNNNPNNGKPYFRTIFEFMPKDVIADVFGSHTMDHTDYVETAINSLGVGGILWCPLNGGQLNLSRTINITTNHRSIKIIGSSGTASRDSSLSTFKWIGPENGGIMFDILQSWGVTFEDVSFNGNDKATNIIRIRAEGDGLPVRPSHRHNFVRCGFGSAYNQLVVLGDGGNEDMINISFDSCQFDYYQNTTLDRTCGIYIDAPQGYCFKFSNCLFARGGTPLNFFHIKSGTVDIDAATFDGNVGSVDIYLDPYNGSISPQLTVTHAETQSDWFLKTASGAGKFPTRTVLLQNIRHRADNGQTKPMSIYWDMGHQCQLVHIGCALHGIEVGPNAASIVEVAPQWGRTGGAYPITGYEGNLGVVTGLNGFNITESSRTSKGGLRAGENLFVIGGADANNQPLNLSGNKIDGDFWINTKSSIPKSQPVLHRYISSGIQVKASDGVVHQQYTRSVVANSTKFDYNLDLLAVPQLNAIYEVRWSVLADKANNIYEMGVFHVFIRRRNTIQIVKRDISLVQESTPIITTAIAMYNPTTGTETTTASASQTALDSLVIRIKFLGVLTNDISGDDLKVSVRRIGHQ